MTPYFFLWLFQILQAQGLLGEISETSNIVNPFTFPELTREILEKIKKATGQPIDTKRFIPILSASSKDVINYYQPFSKISKNYLKHSNGHEDTGEISVSKGGKRGSGNKKGHYNEASNKSEQGNEFEEQEFGDVFGEEHQFLEERFLKKNHQEEGDEEGGGSSKSGRRRGKYFLKKGYRDIFHRDETRKSDSFWDKLHEEGKWFTYGVRNQRKEKKETLSEKEKETKDKNENLKWEKKGRESSEKEEKEVHKKSKKVTEGNQF